MLNYKEITMLIFCNIFWSDVVLENTDNNNLLSKLNSGTAASFSVYRNKNIINKYFRVHEQSSMFTCGKINVL